MTPAFRSKLNPPREGDVYAAAVALGALVAWALTEWWFA